MSAKQHELILASAGTGKTYNLIVHFVGLLLRGVPPEKILATTFTRKAAGEILERVLKHLVEAITKEGKLAQLQKDLPGVDASEAACRRLLASLMRSLDQLKVKTLDAFFVSIARVYALDLGLPPDWQIVDEVVAKELKNEAIARLLAGEDQEEWVKLLWQLQRAAGRRVHEAMFDTVDRFGEAFSESGPEAWSAVQPSFEAATEEELEAFTRALQDAPRAFTKKGDENKVFAKGRSQLLDAIAEESWKELVDQTLVERIVTAAAKYGSAEIPQEFRAAALPIIQHAAALLTAELSLQNQAAFTFLKQFTELHRELQAEESAYRFEDLPLRLAPNLGADPLSEAEYDMWFRIDGRIDHLLLDEFQDTSPVQWRILERIVDELLADGTGERSLFIVGDIKQSIYGFREAEPRLLANLTEHKPELADVLRHIDESYRSSRAVLETVNRVFSEIGSNAAMQEEPWAEAAETLQGQWEEHTPADAIKNRQGAAYLVEAAPETDDRDHKAQVLARAVERVLHIQAEEPDATIGILMRTKKRIPNLIYRLREHGIYASGEGGNPLVDSNAVLHLLSIIHWLDHPGDGQARFHAATSTLGISLQIPERVPGKPETGEALPTLRLLRQRLAREGFGPFTDSLTPIVKDHYSEWDQRRFAQLVDLAHAYDEKRCTRPRAFVEHVRNQRVEDPTAGRVKVMTIHSSKGLEFDAVLLPDLDGKFFPVHELVHTSRPNPYGAIEAVTTAPGRGLSLVEPTLGVLWQEHQRRGMTDILCVLYVAMTRARYRLDIVVKHRAPKADIVKTPAAILRQGLLAGGEAPDEDGVLWSHDTNATTWLETKKPTTPDAATETPTFQLAPTTTPRRLPRRAPSTTNTQTTRAAADLLRTHSKSARHGTLVHTLMEGVTWLESHDRTPADLAHALAKQGASAAETEAAIAAFTTTLEQPEIQAHLARETQPVPAGAELEVHNERTYSLILTDSEGIEHLDTGSIDRLVLTLQDGTPTAATVIDFKTDDITPEQVPTRASHHESQMLAYRQAVAAIYELAPGEVTLKLAFLTPGVVHELV
jgi:ATP-dependent exoDNAse (exonuclease V) beta subunit